MKTHVLIVRITLFLMIVGIGTNRPLSAQIDFSQVESLSMYGFEHPEGNPEAILQTIKTNDFNHLFDDWVKHPGLAQKPTHTIYFTLKLKNGEKSKHTNVLKKEDQIY